MTVESKKILTHLDLTEDALKKLPYNELTAKYDEASQLRVQILDIFKRISGVLLPQMGYRMDTMRDALGIAPAKPKNATKGGKRDKATSNPMKVLKVLSDGKAHTLKDVAEHAGLPPTSATTMASAICAKLVKDGHAVKDAKADPVTFTITKAGTDHYNKVLADAKKP